MAANLDDGGAALAFEAEVNNQAQAEQQQGNLAEIDNCARAQDGRQDLDRRLGKMFTWLETNSGDEDFLNRLEIADLGVTHYKTKKGQQVSFEYQTKDCEFKKIKADDVEEFKKFFDKVKNKTGKSEGKVCSAENLRKYKDALLFGASRKKQRLDQAFLDDMATWFKTYKKYTAKKRAEGKLDENKAAELPIELYRWFCAHFLKTGNIWMLTWIVMQWNCCCRSSNIKAAEFHLLERKADALKITFAKTKADQNGDRVNPKHIFANPHEPGISPIFVLGLYFSISCQDMAADNNQIFPGGNETSEKFNDNIKKVMEEHKAVCEGYGVDIEKILNHSWRKGPATYASSGTTAGPGVVAVSRRADWTLGKVFDTYLKYCNAGDQLCGRILAGLPVDEPKFAALPPHFIGAAASSSDVIEALHLTFGSPLEEGCILHRFPQLKPVLLLCLASMVYHHDWLVAHEDVGAGHVFLQQVPLYRNANLLGRLKKLVTIDEQEGGLRPTGIPPHIKMMQTLQEVQKDVAYLKNELKTEIVAEIHQYLEERMETNGQMSSSAITTLLSTYKDQTIQAVKDAIASGSAANTSPTAPAPAPSPPTGNFRYKADGKDQIWCIPEGFSFESQKTPRKTAWDLWLMGNPAAGIMPYRKMMGRNMPKAAAKQFTLWRSFFRLCEKGLGAADLADPSALEAPSYRNALYRKTTEFLKDRASYIWALPGAHNKNTWGVSYWHSLTKASAIRKNGTAADKGKLEETARNKERPNRRKHAEISEEGGEQ